VAPSERGVKGQRGGLRAIHVVLSAADQAHWCAAGRSRAVQ
jgi:hypothetical protein